MVFSSWEGEAAVFEIEVFNALQTRLRPSKYTTSLQTTLQNATHPKLQNEDDVTWSPQINIPARRTNKHSARSRDRWLILNLSHYTGNMYHIAHSCTSLTCVLYFISLFLIWRPGFEPTVQLKGWNLRALPNETHHMMASILNTPERS